MNVHDSAYPFPLAIQTTLPHDYQGEQFRQQLELLQGYRFSSIELNIMRPEGVDPGSTAGEAGLVRGDVLLEINRSPVYTPSDVEDQISPGSGDILLLVWRQGTTIFVVLNR